MKSIVCIKQVPDTEARIRVDDAGTGIADGDINWVMSPYDDLAIEEALKLKEQHQGEVVLICLGPDRAKSAIRSGLAMGADSAIHLKDPLFENADPLATAKALAAAIKGVEGYDVIFCGQQGVGGDHRQVPGILAELLDLPQVTMAVKVEVADGKARIEREVEGGHEVWEAQLPAVVSAQRGLNEPRYASLKGIMQAKKKKIESKDAAALGLDAAALAPKLEIVKMELPPPRPEVKMIEGNPEEQSKELVRLLSEEAKVI